MADRDWQNLARQVKDRREELGLTQPDIDAAGGPSTAVLRRIENAQSARYQPKTIRQLEQALRLRPGSIRAALTGGTFIPLDDDWPEPPAIRIDVRKMSDDQIADLMRDAEDETKRRETEREAEHKAGRRGSA